METTNTTNEREDIKLDFLENEKNANALINELYKDDVLDETLDGNRKLLKFFVTLGYIGVKIEDCKLSETLLSPSEVKISVPEKLYLRDKNDSDDDVMEIHAENLAKLTKYLMICALEDIYPNDITEDDEKDFSSLMKIQYKVRTNEIFDLKKFEEHNDEIKESLRKMQEAKAGYKEI